MLDLLKKKRHESFSTKMNRVAIQGSLPIFTSPTGA